jgi:hypothetical protein
LDLERNWSNLTERLRDSQSRRNSNREQLQDFSSCGTNGHYECLFIGLHRRFPRIKRLDGKADLQNVPRAPRRRFRRLWFIPMTRRALRRFPGDTVSIPRLRPPSNQKRLRLIIFGDPLCAELLDFLHNAEGRFGSLPVIEGSRDVGFSPHC